MNQSALVKRDYLLCFLARTAREKYDRFFHKPGQLALKYSFEEVGFGAHLFRHELDAVAADLEAFRGQALG